MTQYITPRDAAARFGYHTRTLIRWADAGRIDYVRSAGGQRRYSLESLDKIKSSSVEDTREVILYARVSTRTQKKELDNQIGFLGRAYPGTRCINEVGSGLNFKRKRFIELMDSVQKHEVKRIVVAHKDRLVRFGFEFIEWFCLQHDCSIEVLNHTYKTPHGELMEDFTAIFHCFSSKLYFLRRYEKDLKKDKESLDKVDTMDNNEAIE
jgi:excisionase family DNA binding protein